MVTDPARLGGASRERTLEALTAPELVEVLFDVASWSQQKILVALSLDAQVDPGRLTPLDFDADGHALVDPASSWERLV